MALDLDGFAVFSRIGKHPDIFGTIAVDVKKAARSLLVKHLKAKATILTGIRETRRALGEETFRLVVDGLSDSEVKSALTKLDKHNPELKSGSPSWRREQLGALADGSVEPAQEIAPAKKTPKRLAKAEGAGPKRLNSVAIAATRRRA
jgi:hypothetical protein